MNVKEMREVFNKNPYGWCKIGCVIGLVRLEGIHGNTSMLKVMRQGIVCPEWACYLFKNYYKKLTNQERRHAVRAVMKDFEWSYLLFRCYYDRLTDAERQQIIKMKEEDD